jgi:hypothetical protein
MASIRISSHADIRFAGTFFPCVTLSAQRLRRCRSGPAAWKLYSL